MSQAFRHNTIAISLDYWRVSWTGEWAREVERIDETPPTAEEMRDYDKACALLDELQGYDCFEDGGSDYGAEVRKPTPHREYVYAETEEEWIARTDAWLNEGKMPRDIVDELHIEFVNDVAASLTL